MPYPTRIFWDFECENIPESCRTVSEVKCANMDILIRLFSLCVFPFAFLVRNTHTHTTHTHTPHTHQTTHTQTSHTHTHRHHARTHIHTPHTRTHTHHTYATHTLHTPRTHTQHHTRTHTTRARTHTELYTTSLMTDCKVNLALTWFEGDQPHVDGRGVLDFIYPWFILRNSTLGHIAIEW